MPGYVSAQASDGLSSLNAAMASRSSCTGPAGDRGQLHPGDQARDAIVLGGAVDRGDGLAQQQRPTGAADEGQRVEVVLTPLGTDCRSSSSTQPSGTPW